MPSIAIIRYFICLCLLMCAVFTASAQQLFEGQVVDKETESTLPGVTIKLVKENRVTITNGRGYYKLISTDSLANDSLQFSSIGYKTLRMAVSAYQPNMFILLEASATQLKNVSVTDKKKKIPPLHRFGVSDVKAFRGNFIIPYYATYMFAMQVKAPKKQSRITAVKIGRQEFDQNKFPFGKRALPSPHTRFLLHIMSVDERTGKPKDKIYTKQVSVDDNSLIIDVDVNSDNWTLDTDVFYLAVEWQRTPINEIIVLDADTLARKTSKTGDQKLADAPLYYLRYQPALVAYIDSRKYVAYFMHTPGYWHKYDLKIRVGPNWFDTHVAMSADITY